MRTGERNPKTGVDEQFENRTNKTLSCAPMVSCTAPLTCVRTGCFSDARASSIPEWGKLLRTVEATGRRGKRCAFQTSAGRHSLHGPAASGGARQRGLRWPAGERRGARNRQKEENMAVTHASQFRRFHSVRPPRKRASLRASQHPVERRRSR